MPNAVPKKTLTTLCLVGAVLAVVALLILSRPSAKTSTKPEEATLQVSLTTVESGSLQPTVTSFGRIEPKVNSKVIAQVNGKVDFVADYFRDGGFFQAGDLLLRIEKKDYEIEVVSAEANLAEAQTRLEQEKAQSEQARADWKRLGRSGNPSPLTLRIPQLQAAETSVKAASAQLDKARLNLKRTEIRAPFDGRVLSTKVDLGQAVSMNSELGDIYAIDAIEVRLPLKNKELALLDLPEHRRIEHPNSDKIQAMIHSSLGADESWPAQLIRTSGSIDESSRQLYVIAQINDPFGAEYQERFPLKIGQYVTATIPAKRMENVITIPNQAIIQGTYVYVYENQRVYRRDVVENVARIKP